MELESELVKYIVKDVVFNDYKQNISEIINSTKINWPRLKYLLIYHELSAFLYIIIKNSVSIPEEFSLFLKNTYFQQLNLYLQLHDELMIVLKEAKKRSITMIPIKGFSYSENYYKRFGFRPLVDIDLLIKKDDFEKGVKLLEELGYKEYLLGATEDYWRKKQCHIEFIKVQEKHKVILELHWALDLERNKREILPTLWSRLHKMRLEDNEFYVMSPEDALISLALHQRRFGKVLNLKYVCDVGMLLEKENLNWDYIIKAAYEGRFRASLFFILAQVQIVLDKNLSKYLAALHIPFWQRKSIFMIIKKYTYSSHKDFNLFYLYLICHFLFYDKIVESILYILKIPLEQFAKFYGLPLYAQQTKLRYRIRFVYVFYRLIKDNLGKIFAHKK